MQEILGETDRSKKQKHDFPFTGGLIKCAECSFSITAKHKINRYGYHYIYYHCTKKNPKIKCNQSSIQAKYLEKQFLDFLSKLTIPKSLGELIMKYIGIIDKKNKLITGEKLLTLQKNLKETKNQIDELIRMRYRGFLNNEEYLREKAKLLQEKQYLEEKLDERNFDTVNLESIITKIIDFSQNAHSWFKNANPKTKRLIIETASSNLLLKDKTLLIKAQIPFKLVKHYETEPMVDKVQFEPVVLSLNKGKKECFNSQYSTWLGRMNDVRTFWEENLAWGDKFLTVYEIFVDKFLL